MIRNKKRICLIILLVISLLGLAACGKKLSLPQASQEFYVYDEVNIINDYTKNYIIDINRDLNEKTGAQIVVAAVGSLQDLDISSYALELYEEWKIGSREYDNGVLILLSPNDNSIWIEIGYGLEGQLVDSRVEKIIRDHMIPNFLEKKYSEGILAGFNQILLEVEKEYDIRLIDLERRDDLSPLNDPPSENRGSVPNIFIIIGVIIFLIIDFTFFRGMLIYSIIRGLGRGGGPGASGRGGGSSGGGGRSGGGGAGGSW